jgi:hypothetical protein
MAPVPEIFIALERSENLVATRLRDGYDRRADVEFAFAKDVGLKNQLYCIIRTGVQKRPLAEIGKL